METIKLTQTVEKAIKEFYDKNNFGEDGGINEKSISIKFFSIPIPNFESRNNNVYFHDVNHIVTKSNATWNGESAVSAWEVASGGWKIFLILWFFALWTMGLRIVFHKKSTLNSFEKELTIKNAVTSGMTKYEMDKLTVAKLTRMLSNVP
jgi:hypothetical protein